MIALGDDDSFTVGDFVLLEAYEIHTRIDSIYNLIQSTEHSGIGPDDLTTYWLHSERIHSYAKHILFCSEFFSNELAAMVSILGIDEVEGVKKLSFPPEVTPYVFYFILFSIGES